MSSLDDLKLENRFYVNVGLFLSLCLLITHHLQSQDTPAAFQGEQPLENVEFTNANTGVIHPEITDFLHFQKDTIAIQTVSAYDFDGMWVQLPFNRYSIYQDDTSHLLIGYDPRIHDIWRYDVKANTFLETIGLKYRGDSGLAELASLLYHNADSLFLLENHLDRLWVMDTKTKTRNLVFDYADKTNDDPRFAGVKVGPSWNNSAPIFIYDKRIYFSLKTTVSSTDYAYPLLGFYDFECDSIAIVDIHFPDEYQGVNYGYFKSPNILFSKGRLVVSFPISTDYYIYALDGTLLQKVNRLEEFAVTRPMQPSEDQHDHYENQPHLYATELFCGDNYLLQAGGSRLRANIEDPSSLFALIYDQDFKRVQIIREGKRLFSLGGEYLYNVISPENSEIQYLERYKLARVD